VAGGSTRHFEKSGDGSGGGLMGYFMLKTIVTVALVLAISTIARRSTLLGGILASVPLVSVLAMIWLYAETRDIARIEAFSMSVFWLVIPSLVLFVSLPVLLRAGLGFYTSLAVAIALTAVAYSMLIVLLGWAGIRL